MFSKCEGLVSYFVMSVRKILNTSVESKDSEKVVEHKSVKFKILLVFFR